VEDELPNEIVQDGAQVMHNVANQDAKVEQRELRDCCDPKDMVVRLRVELANDSYLIGVSQEQGADFGLKRVAMFPRSLEFGPASAEIGSVGHG